MSTLTDHLSRMAEAWFNRVSLPTPQSAVRIVDWQARMAAAAKGMGGIVGAGNAR